MASPTVLLMLSVYLPQLCIVFVTAEYYGGDIDNLMEVWSDMLGRDDEGKDIFPQFQTLTLRVKNLVDNRLILPIGEEFFWKHSMYLMKYCIPETHYVIATIHQLPSMKHAKEYEEFIKSNLHGVDKKADDYITAVHKRILAQEERNLRGKSEEYRDTAYRPLKSSYQEHADTGYSSRPFPSKISYYQKPGLHTDSYGKITSPPPYQVPGETAAYRNYHSRSQPPGSSYKTSEDTEEEEETRDNIKPSPTSQYQHSDRFESCYRLLHNINVKKAQQEREAEPQPKEEIPKEEKKHHWRHHHHHYFSSFFGSKNKE